MHRSLLRTASRLARLLIAAGLLISLVTQVTASAPRTAWADSSARRPELVKDIQQMNDSSAPGPILTLKNAFFFGPNNGAGGWELWTSQGTADTTRLLKRVLVGYNKSPMDLTPLDDTHLVFTGQDTALMYQLWISDGTPDGTQQVTHFTNHFIYSQPAPANLNGTVYLSVDNTLWRTNGLEAGTVQVSNLPLVTTNFAVWGDWLYFVVSGPQGKELYRINPDTADPVLVKDLCPQAVVCASGSLGDSNPTALVAASDRVYFIANDETHGRAIWYTRPDPNDGPDTVNLVVDLSPGISDMDVYGALTPVGSDLYFAGTDGFHSAALYHYGGTPVSLQPVTDFNIGMNGYYLDDLVPVNNTLFFTINATAIGPFGLYRTTGGMAENLSGSLKRTWNLIRVGSQVFFMAEGASEGVELWMSNEGGTPQRVTTLPPGSYNPEVLGAWNNQLIFSYTDDSHGLEPWISDGTEAGTHMLKDVNTLYARYPDIPDLTMIYKGQVYFQAASGYDYGAIWRSDGTEAGTQRVTSSRYAPGSGFRDAALSNNLLYYRGGCPSSYSGLLRSDGTEAGTECIFGGTARRFMDANGRLFFISDDETHDSATVSLWVLNKGDSRPTQVMKTGYGGDWQLGALGSEALLVSFSQSGWELTRTDGTATGTRQIYGPISPASLGNTLYSFKELDDMVAFDGRLFFIAPVPGGGAPGLYATDGEQVTLVTSPQGAPTYPINPVVAGDSLYFGGMNGADTVLWRVAKGSSEAQLLHTTATGLTSYQENRIPLPLTAFAGRLVFRADKAGDSSLLWLSDGTPQGTLPLCPTCGYRITRAQRAVAAQGKLYFPASDTQGAWGNEIWVSDGTDAGTYLLADINPGPGSSNPYEILLLGSRLLFVANDGLDSTAGGHGYELWRYDLDSMIYLPTVRR